MYKKVGIIIKSIGKDHLSTSIMESISRAHASIMPHIFTESISGMSVVPGCSVSDYSRLYAIDEYLVTTSLSNLVMAISTNAKKIINYVFAIDFVDINNIEYMKIKDALKDSRVINITRSALYKNIIEHHFGCNVSGIIVDDFDINKFVEIADAKII